MNICIRTDSSVEIGSGHVMRCLVLAEDLRRNQCKVTFICRELPGNLIKNIEAHGFKVLSLSFPETAGEGGGLKGWLKSNWDTDAEQTIETLRDQQSINWFIVDHYALDRRWEHSIKPRVNSLMVIDDLADRPHDCDLLLDQNLYRDMKGRYQKLVPEHATVLTGPKYLLLRQEFRNRRHVKRSCSNVNRILISFGGSDPTNETMKALKAINSLKRPEIAVDVVVGYSNQSYPAIREFCKKMPQTDIHYQIDYLAELMAKADLAIGAGGSTTWERCYMGLPAVTVETAENQSEILSFLSELGAVYHLGKSREVQEDDLAIHLQRLLNSSKRFKDMRKATKFIMKDYEEYAVVKHLTKGE
ncbi:UDP-2,4-diacetamido-2,4,6-trideoxy-beta-L-altropyranose hydrolase [Virgibacillus sp. C22-A2]|uniref:UDP-2,4-diacetamido-2,4, 6-trideoxy-beta-L-altropyranose hydrolase n=1 Tax=Virgibacillus tibetensis TaxID=3042313 RepID=A0ABU6KFY9_9BACI|nr:UDP-2,4-diacetamido-2,4,6-trideoxy-beta-L-altropyranose hydrolase [Virgibacillus sp. C22-A2]